MIAQPAPGPPSAPAKLPGAAGIAVGIGLIVVGFLVTAVLFVLGMVAVAEPFRDLARVPLSSGGTIELDEVGTKYIYVEREAPEAGAGFSTGFATSVPSVFVAIADAEGRSVPVEAVQDDSLYLFDDREAVRIARFEIDEPGTFEVTTVVGDGAGPYRTLSVSGELFDASGVLTAVTGLGLGAFISLVGIVVIVIFAVKRGRARRAHLLLWNSGPLPPGWAPPPGAAPSSWAGPAAPNPPAWSPPPMPPPPPPGPPPAPSAHRPPSPPAPDSDPDPDPDPDPPIGPVS